MITLLIKMNMLGPGIPGSSYVITIACTITVAVCVTSVHKSHNAAHLQKAYHGMGLSETGRCTKLIFERTVNLLRYGVHLVFVIEGASPSAKQRTLQKR